MRFLISCPNDDDNGGIYLWDYQENSVTRVYGNECMGLDYFEENYVVGSRSTYWKGRLDGGTFPHSLVCLDRNFRIVSETPLERLGVSDIHDVICDDSFLWVVDTWSNRVLRFRIAERASRHSLPFGAGEFITPDIEWTDPGAKEKDASHVNGLCLVEGRVWVSVFGRFSRHKEYANRMAAEGCILDITDGLRPHGASGRPPQPVIIKSALSDPHSMVYYKSRLFLTEAGKGRILADWMTFSTIPGGYVRGLLMRGDYLFAGCSASRHLRESSIANSRVIVFNALTGDAISSIEVPAREIYTFLQAI